MTNQPTYTHRAIARLLNESERDAVRRGISVESLYKGVTLRPVVAHSRSYYAPGSFTTQRNLYRSTDLFNESEGNDAPRGGQLGRFTKFIPKRKNNRLANLMNRFASFREAVEKAKRVRAAQERERNVAIANEWVKENVEKIRQYCERKGINGINYKQANQVGFHFAKYANGDISAMKSAVRGLF